MEILQVHPDVLKQIDTQRHRQALQRGASHFLAIQSEPSQPRWLARQQSKLLYRLGHSMVRLGSWIGGQNTAHPV